MYSTCSCSFGNITRKWNFFIILGTIMDAKCEAWWKQTLVNAERIYRQGIGLQCGILV